MPERVRCFVWLLRHDRLLTKVRLAKMHLGSPMCYFCGDELETTLHVLRDCPIAMSIWMNTVKVANRGWFFASELEDWININMSKELGLVTIMQWADCWATTCHAIWTWRNKMIHDNNFVVPFKPWMEISNRVHNYVAEFHKQQVMVNRELVTENIRWKTPEIEWVRLNTDEASRRNNVAGCGGVLRDDNGKWICGFSKWLGVCSAYVAELWGVMEGLKMA